MRLSNSFLEMIGFCFQPIILPKQKHCIPGALYYLPYLNRLYYLSQSIPIRKTRISFASLEFFHSA